MTPCVLDGVACVLRYVRVCVCLFVCLLSIMVLSLIGRLITSPTAHLYSRSTWNYSPGMKPQHQQQQQQQQRLLQCTVASVLPLDMYRRPASIQTLSSWYLVYFLSLSLSLSLSLYLCLSVSRRPTLLSCNALSLSWRFRDNRRIEYWIGFP